MYHVGRFSPLLFSTEDCALYWWVIKHFSFDANKIQLKFCTTIICTGGLLCHELSMLAIRLLFFISTLKSTYNRFVFLFLFRDSIDLAVKSSVCYLIVCHKLSRIEQWMSPPGERRISEISPPLLRGSELYKNLFFPSQVYLLPTEAFAFSVHQTLSPFFHSFIFLVFFVQGQSSANGQPISLLCKAYYAFYCYC